MYMVAEEGITIQLKVTKGKVTFYGSHSNPNPSPVWHDYMLSGIHGDKEILISNPAQDETTVPLYFNFVGMESSTFSIKIMNKTG